MKAIDAAYEVLREADGPMHVSEITRRILDRGLWKTAGRTPERTVQARIGEEINHRGADSRFTREGKGIFGLRRRSPG